MAFLPLYVPKILPKNDRLRIVIAGGGMQVWLL